MTDHEALLASILTAPDDDAPRLVYADWLDEHAGDVACGWCEGRGWYDSEPGDGEMSCYACPCYTCRSTGRVSNGHAERAEFVRVQCELARMPWVPHRNATVAGPGGKQPADPERYDWLRRRERELFPSLKFDLPYGWSARLYFHSHDRSATIRRGFVDELRCTLAAFMGGACGRCNETGEHPNNVHFDCPDCSGTGRTPGAVEVFKRQPVARVVLTDREPYSGRVWWEPRTTDGHPDEREDATIIPLDLFGLLWDAKDNGNKKQDWYGRFVSYPSADAAYAALSAACVRWGRREADVLLRLSRALRAGTYPDKPVELR